MLQTPPSLPLPTSFNAGCPVDQSALGICQQAPGNIRINSTGVPVIIDDLIGSVPPAALKAMPQVTTAIHRPANSARLAGSSPRASGKGRVMMICESVSRIKTRG